LSVRTVLGPSTARFHTPVWTVRPRQATFRGIPTLTATSFPTAWEGLAEPGADQSAVTVLSMRARRRRQLHHEHGVSACGRYLRGGSRGAHRA
jgi:hypothetical protein